MAGAEDHRDVLRFLRGSQSAPTSRHHRAHSIGAPNQHQQDTVGTPHRREPSDLAAITNADLRRRPDTTHVCGTAVRGPTNPEDELRMRSVPYRPDSGELLCCAHADNEFYNRRRHPLPAVPPPSLSTGPKGGRRHFTKRLAPTTRAHLSFSSLPTLSSLLMAKLGRPSGLSGPAHHQKMGRRPNTAHAPHAQ